MIHLIKLAATLALIALLLRKKLKIGSVMLAAAAGLAILYLLPPTTALETVLHTATDPVTLELIAALVLIRMFELVLRQHNTLATMMRSFKTLTGNPRAVIVSMPMLIGMLPSVGGAYFSAPMVDEATHEMNMPGDEKAFINYWFRHPWEFILPLYPGLLLASAITEIPLHTLILANIPFALLMFGLGFLSSMKDIKIQSHTPTLTDTTSLLSFIPVTAVLLLVIILRMKLYLALALVIAALMAFHRYKPKEIQKVLRHGLSLDVVLLIFGVMLFKGVMESTGAVAGLSSFLADTGVPLVITLMALPFITGLLTGITVGFVGVTLPLLISLSGGGYGIDAIALAFAAGFAGVLLSPVHVCLILTKDYFHADMTALYRRLMTPSLLLLAAALIEYFILS